MKYESVPQGEVVFDFGKTGDTFYMLISGNVYCKVPMHKQKISLSEQEKVLFEEAFNDDILSLSLLP